MMIKRPTMNASQNSDPLKTADQPGERVRERVSHLMDARLETQAAPGHESGHDLAAWASAQWQDERVREAWGLYHLVGDVMRSEDLAYPTSPSRPSDADFLAAVRLQLQQAPTVLAPPDRKSTRLNSSHIPLSRMPSSA